MLLLIAGHKPSQRTVADSAEYQGQLAAGDQYGLVVVYLPFEAVACAQCEQADTLSSQSAFRRARPPETPRDLLPPPISDQAAWAARQRYRGNPD